MFFPCLHACVRVNLVVSALNVSISVPWVMRLFLFSVCGVSLLRPSAKSRFAWRTSTFLQFSGSYARLCG